MKAEKPNMKKLKKTKWKIVYDNGDFCTLEPTKDKK